ncbi:hypothetical protein O181_082005 [Austropuccinia psidii MF-1]|uniref:Uncharacterized protein n=1 Tax=Austropuccinia psidii MF-1 TaxID=1389203 RepID=A0A9Q3IKF6_9BASI|nr:hypothetical protein [Austropuccinia psidii MF-1]
MVPIQHINPLLFITDTLTESNTSAPNLTSSNSAIGQRARSHVRKSGLYQTMVLDDESLEEYDIGDEDYVIAEDDGLGMDDVTPPKQAQSLVKRRQVRSNVYDYFEVSHEVQVKNSIPMANGSKQRGTFNSPTNVAIAVSSWQSLIAIRPTSTNTVVDVLGVSTHGLVKLLARVLQQLAPNFHWPKRRLVAQTASQLYFEQKDQLLQEVDDLPLDTPLCGAIDCWTTKDQTESYLAIVLQWINPVDYNFRKSIVAFESLHGP